MDNSNSQNIPSSRQEKSMFWKVGMIFIFYFLAIFIVIIPLSIIWFFVFLGQDHSITELVKTKGGYYSYIFLVATLISGLIGIRYGVNYVSRKAIIARNDVAKIIVWFLIINIVLRIINISSLSTKPLLFFLVTLAINCFAIKFFFQKALQ